MKKFLIAVIFALALFFSTRAQTPAKVSLIVSNCEPTEGLCKTNHLYRYNFVNGEYISKELIITSKTDAVNFGQGNNRIYQNRYALTLWGDVVDIQKKKILHESAGQLFRTEGSKIFVSVNRTNIHGLFFYDLVSGKYNLVSKTDDMMFFGVMSPNGFRSALYTCSDCGIKIFENNGKERLIKGKLTVQRDGLNTSALNRVPIFWLDEERFLTQTKNGSLVTITLDGKITPLVEFEIKGLQSQNPKIFRNEDGKIIYRYITDYEIDVENKTYKNLNYSFGEFSIDYTVLNEKKFFYQNNEIGRFPATYYPKTVKDYVAVLYAVDGRNGRYSGGVKVWNTIKKDWTTIEIKWNPSIIGWITE